MTHRTKYPRTPHLPWSPGRSSDDLKQTSTDQFVGREVVVTEKMDGENTTMYRDGIHARSTDSKHHPSRSWVKNLHQTICYNIPQGWRICGENLYARHSIAYHELPSFFVMFSIWNEENVCLPWNQTQEWADLLELHLPKVLYRGIWDEDTIRNLPVNTDTCEGYVVRDALHFHYDDFSQHIAKYVRAGHVQTDEHWMFQSITPNELAKP